MPETIHPTQIVVAYDFSPSAEQALMRAVDVVCRAPHHVLHILTALDKHTGIAAVPTRDASFAYAEQIREQAVEHVTAMFAGRVAIGDVHFFVHARIGKAADEILALAEEVGADLVFIGSHGATGVERLLLGSVSERVVREAKCPVMVVRPKSYQGVDLIQVISAPHSHPYNPPHRYSYVGSAVVTRPNDWPIS